MSISLSHSMEPRKQTGQGETAYPQLSSSCSPGTAHRHSSCPWEADAEGVRANLSYIVNDLKFLEARYSGSYLQFQHQVGLIQVQSGLHSKL